MNIETGELVDSEFLESIPVLERKKFIPVVRDLSKYEELDKQIHLYSPCGCGSGKKFKFCCHKSSLTH